MCFSIRVTFLILFLPIAALAHIDPRAGCLNNLRQMDGAKEMFALEHKLKPGDAVEPELLNPYFPGGIIPQCLAGGHYTIGPIGVYPVCSIPGHSEAALGRGVEQQVRHERILFWVLICGATVVTAWVALAVSSARNRTRWSANHPVQRTGAFLLFIKHQ